MKKINYKNLFEKFLKNEIKVYTWHIRKMDGVYRMFYDRPNAFFQYVLGTNKKEAIKEMRKIFKTGE